MADIEAILFDLDGTLVDSERESAEAMVRALADHGVAANERDREFIIGRSWVEIYRHLQATYPEMTLSRDELIAATTVHREDVIREQGMTILPGVFGAFERFERLPFAVVTGSSRAEAAQAISVLKAQNIFQAVFAAEDVPTSKPDPAGYRMAAEALGVAPERCLVLEDSQAGIAAGTAAGAHVVAVAEGNFAGQDQSQAKRIIRTLDELTWELLAAL